MALDVDILILGWSPTAVGAAIAARNVGSSVAVLGLAAEGGIRSYWRIGPTPLNDGSLSGHEYEDVAIATLSACGAHAFPDAFMAGGRLNRDENAFTFTADDPGLFPGLSRVRAQNVLVATNADAPDETGIANLREGFNRGVSMCAWSDAAFFRPGPVGVYGADRLAVDQALWARHFGCAVEILVPRGQLAVPGWLRTEFSTQSDEITVRTDIHIDQVLLEDGDLVAVRAGDRRIDVRALFLARLESDPWDAIGEYSVPTELRQAPGVTVAGRLTGLDLQDDRRLFLDGERAVVELVGGR